MNAGSENGEILYSGSLGSLEKLFFSSDVQKAPNTFQEEGLVRKSSVCLMWMQNMVDRVEFQLSLK